MPDFAIEDEFEGIIAGIDEAGRGPWAGPVVAAAVIIADRKKIEESGINDSKKLSALKREKLFPFIKENFYVGVGIVHEEDIDELNILGATKKAMRLAVEDLPIFPDIALIDGNHKAGIKCKEVPVIKGDSKSLSIAAASIIAKVTRDNIMKELHEVFPEYGWGNNAGYGTKEHQEALAKFGITKHHRKSFAPIKKLIAA